MSNDQLPQIRWHQTADFGYVPNLRMPNTFMAVAMDLGDRNSPFGRYWCFLGFVWITIIYVPCLWPSLWCSLVQGQTVDSIKIGPQKHYQSFILRCAAVIIIIKKPHHLSALMQKKFISCSHYVSRGQQRHRVDLCFHRPLKVPHWQLNAPPGSNTSHFCPHCIVQSRHVAVPGFKENRKRDRPRKGATEYLWVAPITTTC